jgi:LPS sulfotransferase NodH
MTKVLFVVGMARSGSTLLTALLNRVDGFAGLGETHVYWELAGGEERCGCGSSLAECELWGTLYREQLERGVDHAELRDSFRDFVRPRPSSQLRGLLARRGGSGGARLRRYVAATEETYSWLAERTESSVLVDSSKLPTAAELTAAADSMDVYLVHLVRDPRAVAHSLARQQRPEGDRSPRGALRYLAAAARASLDWTLRNAYAEAKLGRASADRYRRLRFEDLTREPRATVAGLLELLGTEPAPEVFVTTDTVELGGNHILTGNSVRFQRGAVTIAPAERWRTEMPRHAQLLATLLTLPLLALYRYPLRPRPG